MSKKGESNIVRVINDLIFGENYYTKSDNIRVVRDNLSTTIMDRGTMLGYLLEGYNDEAQEYLRFLVLDLADYKSDPLRTKHKKELAKEANNSGIFVVFVPVFDLGFGTNAEAYRSEFNKNYEYLLKTAKFSPDKDIKTAAMLIERAHDGHGDILCLTYNQYNSDNVMTHAEDILVMYTQMADYIPDELACISLYEPCADCLNKLLSLNVDTILWSEPHKPKWNTDEYIQLTNDIWIGLKKNISNGRVIYKRAVHKKVTKFYDKVLRGDKTK